jgi:hypothetical protein
LRGRSGSTSSHSSSETTHGFSAIGSLLWNVDATGFRNQHGGFLHFETSSKRAM